MAQQHLEQWVQTAVLLMITIAETRGAASAFMLSFMTAEDGVRHAKL